LLRQPCRSAAAGNGAARPRVPAAPGRGRAAVGGPRARSASYTRTVIRSGGARDVPFLRDMLRHAFYWRTPVGDEEPPLTRYVNGWGRPGDRSLIVFDEFVPVGAAWYRLFTGEGAGFGFVDEQTPELALAAVPSPDGGLGAGRVRDQGGRARRRQARRPGRRPAPGFGGRERVEGAGRRADDAGRRQPLQGRRRRVGQGRRPLQRRQHDRGRGRGGR